VCLQRKLAHLSYLGFARTDKKQQQKAALQTSMDTPQHKLDNIVTCLGC